MKDFISSNKGSVKCFILIIMSLLLFECGHSDHDTTLLFSANTDSEITCNSNGCNGIYVGPEFLNGSDIAHQFSNQMANRVGQELKTNYSKGIYLKVDLKKIKMTTENMDNKGDVAYTINIPFLSVSDSCKAATAFDHRGGWGHKISEESVKYTFRHKRHLEYEEHQTPEGLQEFWIQWQHKDWQKGCP